MADEEFDDDLFADVYADETPAAPLVKPEPVANDQPSVKAEAVPNDETELPSNVTNLGMSSGNFDNSQAFGAGYDGHGAGAVNGSGLQDQYHGMEDMDGQDGQDDSYGPIGIKEDG